MIPIEQEPDHVPRKILAESAIVIGAGIVASVLVTLMLVAPYLGEVTSTGQAPEPIDINLFQAPTRGELQRQAAEARLQSYGWVDRDRGIVHVPLEVAIQLYLGESPR